MQVDRIRVSVPATISPPARMMSRTIFPLPPVGSVAALKAANAAAGGCVTCACIQAGIELEARVASKLGRGVEQTARADA